MRLIQRGLVISCERTCSAMGAVRIWQRWGWAVCNYVDPMVCLRNSQWWCLMIMLILGSFAKGVCILYNPSFMLKILIQHFWATCATVRKAMVVCTNCILYWGCSETGWTSEYIYIQPSQVLGVGGGWVGVMSASHGCYQDVFWHCFHFVWCSHMHGLCGVNVSLLPCHHISTLLQRFMFALFLDRISWYSLVIINKFHEKTKISNALVCLAIFNHFYFTSQQYLCQNHWLSQHYCIIIEESWNWSQIFHFIF